MSEPEAEEGRGWRQLHSEKLYNLCFSPIIIRLIKSRRIRYV
jgi:hypothetical protein